MSLFDNLFGGGAKQRDIAAANRDATNMLNSGLDRAIGINQDSIANQQALLNRGYDQAGNLITQGMNNAAGAVNQGYDTARGALDTQFGNAANYYNQGYDRATNTLDPYLQSGNQAQDLYNTYLGLNGQPAATDAYNAYASNDPFRQYRDSLANQQLMSLYNARGLGGSGRESLALGRASLERGTQDLNQYLDRLSGQAQRGQNVAGQLAGYGMQTGQSLAGNAQTLGTNQANLATNHGNAIAGIHTQGNQALANNAIAQGTAGASVTGAGSNALMNLIYGNAQQNASNRINVGNAYAQTRGSGIQNIANLAGTAMKAYAGIPKLV